MSEQVTALVDHYFREEYGKAVSFLTSKYGGQRLEIAEDAVQEALYKAMQTWPYGQIPKNPSGWIVTVASNKMIDHFRKTARISDESVIPDTPMDSKELELSGISDDVIKMMFACCHPSLSTEYQIILTLKILGGLSVREIARALLKKEESVAKSYTRAKKKFKEENIALVLPSPAEIKNRIRTVLHIIYLLFNEGYKTTEGDQLLRKDLCLEALRLNRLLLANEATNVSMTNSLLALMLFHTARFDSRTNTEGQLVTLKNQDRSKWNQDMISEGKSALQKATKGSFLNEYYVQAAIIGMHCEAKNYESTRWDTILELYDALLRIKPSPIVRLNRTVALAKARSVEEALIELDELIELDQLQTYYLFHAIRAELLHQSGQTREAISALDMAISLSTHQKEIDHLREKKESLQNKKPSPK